MSQIQTRLSMESRIAGTVAVGGMIVNDWVITMEEIPGGHRLTARRGTEVQSMDVMDGTIGSIPGEENVGKLLYIGTDGQILPLALGSGLEIVDGVLTVNAAGGAIVSLTVDSEGNAVLEGAPLSVDADGSAVIKSAALIVDEYGNATIG